MSKILYLSFVVLLLAFSFVLEIPLLIIGIIFFIMISVLITSSTIVKKMTRETLLALTIGSVASLLFIFTIIFICHLVVSTMNIDVSEALNKNKNIIYIFVAFVIAKTYLIFSTTFSFLPELSNMLRRWRENLEYAKILDTSVIVDGRIADIAEKGFFDGNLIVPEFVLKEVQALSDSHDAQKRIRGRRALDVVNRMRSSKNVVVTITEVDFPKIKEVDLKLIELSKKISAKVITNDFNLMKVAEIHGVEILNLNDLANMMYVTVLPGDLITVTLAREGKDKQALAYLEDGTMIVVDNAKHLIGKNIEIKIESILPKEAGRVIFASISNIHVKNLKHSKDNKSRPIKKRSIIKRKSNTFHNRENKENISKENNENKESNENINKQATSIAETKSENINTNSEE